MAQPPDLAPPAQPITATKAQWTFAPIDGMVCDDGSPTGIGVYLTDSPNLLVFLNGGGACWDYTTCFLANTSTHGPFGAEQFQQLATGGISQNTVLSEGDTSPFKGWNKVFVPYCTGDIHGGDAVQNYMTQGGMMGTIHHKGYPNIYLALARLGATIPSPAKVVWSGSSAGGYGATINYIQARSTWPKAKGYLIDDSGPVFIEDGISDFLKNGWIPSWNLAATFFKVCPMCMDGDWSLGYSVLSQAYPNDRMALLSTEQDQTIRGYLLLQPQNFQTDLNELAQMRFDTTQNFRYFFQTGSTHTMLGDLPSHTTGSVNVGDWIKQMVSDDPAWNSVKP
jgi:hypothetical protein